MEYKVDSDYEEQLQLDKSDQPVMQLITFPLTDSNYTMWRNAIITALLSKDKLGIVDGSCPMPESDSVHYRKWRKVNAMVVSWINASISKEIVHQFAYINNAADLWKEIEERYGVSNIDMMFQIKKDIANMRHENLGITEYYEKLKNLTDQLVQLRPGISGDEVLKQLGKGESADFFLGAKAALKIVAKMFEEMSAEDRAMEFLLGLNDVFSFEKDMILLMDPFPNVDKIYSIMLKAEQNRQVALHIGSEITGMSVKGSQQLSRDAGRNKTFNRREKSSLFCTHCKRTGHAVESCFKLKGYPDWWDPFKKKNNTFAAQVSKTSLEWNENLIAAVEEIQMMARERTSVGAKETVGMACFGEFSGPSY